MAKTSKATKKFRRCVNRLGGGKKARGKCLFKVYGPPKRRRKASKSASLSGCGCGV